MTIYGPSPIIGSDNRYHYVYRITNIVEQKHYYGVRSSKISPFDDLGKKYFSSAKRNSWIIENQQQNPNNYKYKIIRTFITRKEASEFECLMHKKFNVANSDKFYNATNQGTPNFDSAGKVTVCDINGNTLQVACTDERYLSGELISIAVGKIVVKDETGKCYQVEYDDERYLSGELISIHSGKTIVKNDRGEIFYVDKNDPRILSGELVSVVKGMISVKDNSGNNYKLHYGDPRLETGEYVGITKGTTTVKTKDGKTLSVSVDDPKLLSGEYVGVTKGFFPVKDKHNNIFIVTKKDPRYLSGEVVSLSIGKTVVQDINGNVFRIDKTDPRYIRGEVFSIRLGSNNPKFKNYRVTPWGIFDSAKSLGPEITRDKLDRWCTINNKQLTKMLYNRYEKFRNTFGPECIGKTFKELGFYLLPKEEYQQLQNTNSLPKTAYTMNEK